MNSKQVLRTVAHPDIVEAETTYAHLESFATSQICDVRQIRMIFQRVAGALSHAHRCNYAHGAVDGASILLRNDGSPLLSGFGRAVAVKAPSDEACIDDVKALGALLSGALTRDVSSLRTQLDIAHDLVISLRKIANTARQGELTAGAMCAELHNAAVPKARTRVIRSVRRSTKLRAVAVVSAIAMSSMSAGAWINAFEPHHTPVAAPIPHTLTIDVAGSRFETPSQPGDKVVSGRWTCGVEQAAIVRASDGSVWVFDALPQPGANTTGKHLAIEGWVTDLRAEPRGNGCDALVASRGTHGDLELDTRNIS